MHLVLPRHQNKTLRTLWSGGHGVRQNKTTPPPLVTKNNVNRRVPCLRAHDSLRAALESRRQMFTTMKTASQIIRALLFSPDQHPGNGTPEFESVCQDARDFLAMEREVQEARALAKTGNSREAMMKIDELRDKHGLTESIRATEHFVSGVRLAFRNLKLEALLKEALELASQSDQDFERENHGPNRVTEIAKEAAAL